MQQNDFHNDMSSRNCFDQGEHGKGYRNLVTNLLTVEGGDSINYIKILRHKSKSVSNQIDTIDFDFIALFS